MGTLVGRLDEHDGVWSLGGVRAKRRRLTILCYPTGPVRGVAFHPFRDLLVRIVFDG